jgi:hypothetical protein
MVCKNCGKKVIYTNRRIFCSSFCLRQYYGKHRYIPHPRQKQLTKMQKMNVEERLKYWRIAKQKSRLKIAKTTVSEIFLLSDKERGMGIK